MKEENDHPVWTNCKDCSAMEKGDFDVCRQCKSENITYKEEMLLRAKWTFDGAQTKEEMVEKLEEFADDIRNIDDDWTINGPVKDDYAFLFREVEE